MTDRDPQVKAVYKWETACFSGLRVHSCSLKTARRAIRYVCREWGIPVPVLASRRMQGYLAAYLTDYQEIWVHPRQGRNAHVLAHELAHHLVTVLAPRAQDHGPLWLGVYCRLLAQFGLGSVGAMRFMAREHGLAIASEAVVAALRASGRRRANRR